MVQGVKLIGVLTYDSTAVQRLSRCGAAAVLADALRSRADDRDFVYDAILGLANLVTLDENAAAFRHDAKRLDALGDVLERPRRRRGHRDVRAQGARASRGGRRDFESIAELVGKVARAAPDLAEKPQTLAFELIAYLAVQKSSPRNDLVKNYCAHPTHWLISTQALGRQSRRTAWPSWPRAACGRCSWR